MKKLFILTLICFCFSVAFSQIGRKELNRVFGISRLNNEDTCFEVIDSFRNSWIITAGHLFKGEKKQSGDTLKVKLKIDSSEVEYTAKIFLPEDPECDLAILLIGKRITSEPFALNETGLALSSDVFLLGYPILPIGRLSTEDEGNNFPIVLKGFVSGFFKAGICEYAIVSVNNINGMSGGPVLSFSNKTNNYEAIGVIAGYFPNKSTIHRSADEVVVKEYFAANNSGLAYIVLFNLKNAISSIRMVFYKNQGYIKFL